MCTSWKQCVVLIELLLKGNLANFASTKVSQKKESDISYLHRGMCFIFETEAWPNLACKMSRGCFLQWGLLDVTEIKLGMLWSLDFSANVVLPSEISRELRVLSTFGIFNW